MRSVRSHLRVGFLVTSDRFANSAKTLKPAIPAGLIWILGIDGGNPAAKIAGKTFQNATPFRDATRQRYRTRAGFDARQHPLAFRDSGKLRVSKFRDTEGQTSQRRVRRDGVER